MGPPGQTPPEPEGSGLFTIAQALLHRHARLGPAQRAQPGRCWLASALLRVPAAQRAPGLLRPNAASRVRASRTGIPVQAVHERERRPMHDIFRSSTAKVKVLRRSRTGAAPAALILAACLGSSWAQDSGDGKAGGAPSQSPEAPAGATRPGGERPTHGGPGGGAAGGPMSGGPPGYRGGQGAVGPGYGRPAGQPMPGGRGAAGPGYGRSAGQAMPGGPPMRGGMAPPPPPMPPGPMGPPPGAGPGAMTVPPSARQGGSAAPGMLQGQGRPGGQGRAGAMRAMPPTDGSMPGGAEAGLTGPSASGQSLKSPSEAPTGSQASDDAQGQQRATD